MGLDGDGHPRVLVQCLGHFAECFLATVVELRNVGCETNAGLESSLNLQVGLALGLPLVAWVDWWCRVIFFGNAVGAIHSSSECGCFHCRAWWDSAGGLAIEHTLELVGHGPGLLVGCIVGVALLVGCLMLAFGVAKACLGVLLRLINDLLVSLLSHLLGSNGLGVGRSGFLVLLLGIDVRIGLEENRAVALSQRGEGVFTEHNDGVLSLLEFFFGLLLFVLGSLGFSLFVLGLIHVLVAVLAIRNFVNDLLLVLDVGFDLVLGVGDKLTTFLLGFASSLHRLEGGVGLGEVVFQGEAVVFGHAFGFLGGNVG